MFEVIIIAAIAIIVGFLIGYFLMLKVQKGRSKAAVKEAQAIVSDAQREAENMRREALVEAKDEALKIKQDVETFAAQRPMGSDAAEAKRWLRTTSVNRHR